jgi:hypothetical protein
VHQVVLCELSPFLAGALVHHVAGVGILYILFLPVKMAAETVYKIGLLAINGFDFSMELA